ncbi:hypothetical protein AGRA3207_007880 (plasmid) [Actinomadura graeca]|uniref:Uncharacterized protein n=1 Tax=Actinomadura graeca TaxID=2750812 RepID=A0ABX8RAV4_9ACTN|nr:hypothetical protein [Actinomadura graeca]QXJ27082.1 hypothetical protein AGRA3207_007880 [Actinomadura graeca]
MLSNIVSQVGQGCMSPPPLTEPVTAALVWALERMSPAVWERAAGESPVAAEARRLAAADILDDLLGEYAELVAGDGGIDGGALLAGGVR